MYIPEGELKLSAPLSCKFLTVLRQKNAKFAKVDARFPRIFSLHNRTTDTENACV